MKVLVLHASALHLGFLGCYGNSWITTPHLDRLAVEAVVFDQHYADCPGFRTCWSGRYHRPGVVLPLLVTDLVRRHGLAFARIEASEVQPSDDATVLEQTLEATVEALDRLAGRDRWLCWVDLPSLQPPWDMADDYAGCYLAAEPGEEDDEPLEPLRDPVIGPMDGDDLILWERLRCTFAGAVTYLDAGIGLLLDELKQRDWYGDLLLVFTADRGLALGEHGIIGDCRPWLHEEVVHVPLIVRLPRGADAGQRVFAVTQPIDLAATLLDVFQVPMPALDGQSLLPLLRGQTATVREHVLSRWALEEDEEWALRTREWALLLPIKQAGGEARPVQLYAKPEDRWEVNNLVQHHLELVEELERKLKSFSHG
jgi:arylsulfatase A-like enzyme